MSRRLTTFNRFAIAFTLLGVLAVIVWGLFIYLLILIL
jgi:hypothetical protein